MPAAGNQSVVALINERFAGIEQRFRDIDADRRATDADLDQIQNNMAVLTEQVATMISAFKAARTAFYSLTSALIVACVVFLLTGHV